MAWVKAKKKASLKPYGHVGTVAQGRSVNLSEEEAEQAVASGDFVAVEGPSGKKASTKPAEKPALKPAKGE